MFSKFNGTKKFMKTAIDPLKSKTEEIYNNQLPALKQKISEKQESLKNKINEIKINVVEKSQETKENLVQGAKNVKSSIFNAGKTTYKNIIMKGHEAKMDFIQKEQNRINNKKAELEKKREILSPTKPQNSLGLEK